MGRKINRCYIRHADGSVTEKFKFSDEEPRFEITYSKEDFKELVKQIRKV